MHCSHAHRSFSLDRARARGGALRVHSNAERTGQKVWFSLALQCVLALKVTAKHVSH